MSAAEIATPATETITVTTVTVTEPTTTASTTTQKINVYRVNRRIDKNDPDRFKGEGFSFNAKLIGIEEVPDARGDKMCQEKIHKLKAEVKAAGVHKQKIIVNVSEEGIKIVDVRHGVVEHSHPVHKVSFISRDMTDSRAFGYIYSTEEKKHMFYAIKTEKAAEHVVLTLRDLFQIIFERKKKEMEAVKKEQEKSGSGTEQKAEENKEEKQDPNVIKLDGELNTESTTDEEPVYSVPQNNKPVKERAGSSLVDLESELETIGQGIEQMNKLEVFFESENPPTSAPANDPWASTTTSTTQMPQTSSSSDLQDIDLFGTKPASPVDKNAILGLFGNQPTMPPSNPNMLHPGFGAQPQPGFGGMPPQPNPGFGGMQPQPPHGFGGMQPQPQPTPGFGGQPGFGAQTVNPFGASASFAQNSVGGFPAFSQAGFGAPQTSNPFGGLSTAAPAAANDPFGEPLLAPEKLNQPEGRDSPKPPPDAFGDLCEIGTKSTDKTPKQLFAEKSASTKKPMNALLNTNKPDTQASSEDPFGTLDAFSLPEATSMKTKEASHDPFDTSFINNPLKLMQHTPSPPCNKINSKPDTPKQLDILPSNDGESDCDNFDLPSPEGPPPPLPPERKIDKMANIPPAPPPRPNSSPITSQRIHSCDNPAPAPPPRNIPMESHKTSIKPVPRPRPLSRGQGEITRKESHSSQSSLGENTPKIVEENNNLDTSGHERLSMNSSSSSSSSSRFVIEDPFENNDPFADCDPFKSSDGFCNDPFANSHDPFTIGFSSQNNGHKNGHSSTTSDPFAVFDKSISEAFSFKSNGVQKNFKVSSENSKQLPPANDPFDTFFK